MTSGVSKNPPSLDHLRRLTTDFGIIQHAIKSEPDPRFGYSIDDQARALIACLWYRRQFGTTKELEKFIKIYTDFIHRAQTKNGDFHNFYDINGRALDEKGSADSFGRTVWALAEALANHPTKQLQETAKRLLAQAKASQHLDHRHLRTRAYLALGYAVLSDKVNTRLWADELIRLLRKNSTRDWYWFEDALIYCNAVPIYALAKAYELTRDKTYIEEAKKTFLWLNRTSRINGAVAPIGQDGWYHKKSDKAHYDQQPVDAAKMVMAATEIYKLTRQKRYLDAALEWMGWYSGANIGGRPLIDSKTGGIYDALTPTGVNENQGAESIVTYLLAYLSLSTIQKDP